MPNNGIIRYGYRMRDRWRQARPYNLALEYSFEEGRLLSEFYGPSSWGQLGGTAGSYWQGDSPPFMRNSLTPLYNATYEKLRSKMYDSAGWGVDIVEFHQTESLIVNSAKTLLAGARKIKKLDFVGAAKVFGSSVKPPGASVHKSFANNFLAFHFGVEPLMADIHDGLKVLSNPLNAFTAVRARTHDFYEDDGIVNYGSWHHHNVWDTKVFVTQSARVTGIKSPGIHLAEQFGIVNPLSLAWEVVPFSFVVDWFANVGDYLRQFSDFAGLDLSAQCRGLLIKQNGSSTAIENDVAGSLWHKLVWTWTRNYRYTGLSGVAFEIKKLKPPSLTRGATQVSLLTQFLRH